MRTSTFFCFALALVCVGMFYGPSASAQTTIFQEDWSSGTISGAKWTTAAPPGTESGLIDLGSGDFAYFSRVINSATQHAVQLYSVDSFSRGSDIRCTFRAWGDPTRGGWNGAFPQVSMIGGPWRQSNTGNHVGNQEACVSLWAGQPIRFSQNQWDSGTALSGAYNAAWAAATSKANSILHRVWLGGTQGGRMEWSTDNGATWKFEADTRGLSGGNQAAGLFLGFGNNGAAVLIDDIVVQTGGTAPPLPSPISIPIVENWNSGTVQENLWALSVQMTDGTGLLELEEYDPVNHPGDMAMFARGPLAGETFSGSNHQTHFFSRVDFPRGDNIRCRFTIWNDRVRTGWASSQPEGGHYMVGGPWHSDQGNLLFMPEAMIRYWSATGQEFAQPGDPWTTSPKLSLAYHDAFIAAGTRNTAMTIRVTLGAVDGALIEWRADGQGITDWVQEFDTRGTPPLTASDTAGYIGFGTYSGGMFYDDIVVENDSNPGPPFVPSGVPTPTPPPMSVEDWQAY